MAYNVDIESSIGVNVTYVKLAAYSVECSDKQYISAIFQLYASKKARNSGFKPIGDTIEIKLELEKDFTGNMIKTIYEKAGELAIFVNSEVI